MIKFLKRCASYLPLSYQQELKRIHFGRQISRRRFVTDESEYARLSEWVRQGDWVLDIGANVGHYSARLSELVGDTGRVIAFEPVPRTFELLSANMARSRYSNITLLNVAVSEQSRVAGMTIPKFDAGPDNYYEARLINEATDLSVFCISIDSLEIPNPVSLVKIDVEGHELQALTGMVNLIKASHPTLIVEGRSSEVASLLASLGYRFEESQGSPNRVFLPIEKV